MAEQEKEEFEPLASGGGHVAPWLDSEPLHCIHLRVLASSSEASESGEMDLTDAAEAVAWRLRKLPLGVREAIRKHDSK